MIVDYIDSHRDRFGVEPICAVLSEHGLPIAPSTYYARRARRVTDAQLEDVYLANALVTLWTENWRSTAPGNCGGPPPGRAWRSAASRWPG